MPWLSSSRSERHASQLGRQPTPTQPIQTYTGTRYSIYYRGGGVLDRRDVLDLMHGRSRMTIGGGGGGCRNFTAYAPNGIRGWFFLAVSFPGNSHSVSKCKHRLKKLDQNRYLIFGTYWYLYEIEFEAHHALRWECGMVNHDDNKHIRYVIYVHGYVNMYLVL